VRSANLASMTHLIFKCPLSGMNVYWRAEEIRPEEAQCTYETIVCQACSRLHFINRATGKLLGEQVRQK
jgi:hypothetical protein